MSATADTENGRTHKDAIGKALRESEKQPSPTKLDSSLPGKEEKSNGFWKSKKFIAFAVTFIVLIGGFLLFNSSYFIERVPVSGGNYTEAIANEPRIINPLYASRRDVDQDISSLIFSGLLKYDKGQQLAPDLAESYEITEDQKNFTFKLRDGLTWSDGRALTADDIIFTVQTIKNPETQSPLQSTLSSVAVEKIDDLTVKFTLTKDAYSPFIRENATFGILPKHIWEEEIPASMETSDLNLKPVGSGPFKFKEFKKDKKTGAILSYTLERNDRYYGEKPLIDYFTMVVYPDWESAVQAFEKKEVMGVSYIPEDVKSLIEPKSESFISFHYLRLPRYYALFFNWEQNPILKERNVRRAIAHLIDYDRIVYDAQQGNAFPIYSAILPNFLGHNPEITGYEFSVEKASEELEKGGWTLNEEDGFRYKDGKKLEFTITFHDQENFIRTVEILQEDLKKVGISVISEPIDPATLRTEYVQTRGYEALIYGQLLLHDPDPYPFWHSSARKSPGLNLSSYASSEVDDLLETARKEGSEEERVKKYLHFQNTLYEDLPAIFLYSPTYLYAQNDDIKGYDVDSITLPYDRFSQINEWYIKTTFKIKKR